MIAMLLDGCIQAPLAALRMMWLELIGLCQELQGFRKVLDGCRNVFKAQRAGCILGQLVSFSDL